MHIIFSKSERDYIVQNITDFNSITNVDIVLWSVLVRVSYKVSLIGYQLISRIAQKTNVYVYLLSYLQICSLILFVYVPIKPAESVDQTPHADWVTEYSAMPQFQSITC